MTIRGRDAFPFFLFPVIGSLSTVQLERPRVAGWEGNGAPVPARRGLCCAMPAANGRARPTSAPIRRANIPPVLAGQRAASPDGEQSSPAIRPSSARAVPLSARASLNGPGGGRSRDRPASASVSGRQPVYVMDSPEPQRPASARGPAQVRGSFGAWQGKKFAILHTPDSSSNDGGGVQFAGIQGMRTRLERPQSAGYRMLNADPNDMSIGGLNVGRGLGGAALRLNLPRKSGFGGHASFLEPSARKLMIDKIRANNVAQEAIMFQGTKTADAFMPRLRPRSATARLSLAELNFDALNSHRSNYVSPRSRSPARSRSPVRGADGNPRVDIRQKHFRPGHMLTDLNLPSIAEVDVEHTIDIVAVRDALSVDPEVALSKLARAGDGAKFCDDSFPPTDAAIGAPDLEELVECWARPEAFGLSVSGAGTRGVKGPVLYPPGGFVSDVQQGALGDCYLLGALSVVACRPDLLDQIFGHFKLVDSSVTHASLMSKGLFTVQVPLS